MTKTNTWNSKLNPSEMRISQAWWLLATALAAALVLGWGTVNTIWLLGSPIALFIFGLTIAAALEPIVAWLGRKLPHLLAIVLVYVVLAVLLGAVLWAVAPTVADQLKDIPSHLPDFTAQAQQSLSRLTGGLIGSSFTKEFGAQLKGKMGGQNLVQLPVTITTGLLDIIVVIFVSIYTLLGAASMKTFLLSLFPERQREHVADVVGAMAGAMGGYIRGVFINGVIVGALTFGGLLLLQIRFAAAFAVLAGLLEMVPVIGPIVSGALIVGLTLLQSPTKALEALLFMIVMQQLENHILVPNIMRSQTDVSPLVSILALLAGAAISGLTGAIVSIPMATALSVLVRRVIAPALRRQTGAEPVEESSS